MNIEIGQGFRRQRPDGARPFYGLVTGLSDGRVSFVPVMDIYDLSGVRLGRIRCYDDPDAVEKTDKDNVRLESCPPPFSAFGTYSNKDGKPISNSVAIADMRREQSVPMAVFVRGAEVIDGGAKVSDYDMARVYSHPWQSRNQRERICKDMTEMNLDSGPDAKQDDPEFGV